MSGHRGATRERTVTVDVPLEYSREAWMDGYESGRERGTRRGSSRHLELDIPFPQRGHVRHRGEPGCTCPGEGRPDANGCTCPEYEAEVNAQKSNSLVWIAAAVLFIISGLIAMSRSQSHQFGDVAPVSAERAV